MTIDAYEMWDASYVLGALSSSERREYETHLAECVRCRSAVADLSGVPALLALVDDELEQDRSEAGATVSDVPPLRPGLLAELLAKVNQRRLRTRWMAVTAMAVAAVVLAVGVFVATRPGVLDPTLVPRTTVTAMAMDPVGDSEFAASFTMTRHDWGTNIDMTCTYSEGDHSDSDGGSDADRLAMVAIGRDGSHVQLGTWKARSGETAQTSGSTSMPIDEIAAVQVVAADTGDVLLQRNL